MKIVHVLTHYFPARTAGTEIYTQSLIHALSERNIESVIVIPGHGEKVITEYEMNGIRITRYPETSVVDRSLVMGKKKAGGISGFIEILKQEQPDIVQFHDIAGSNGITVDHLKESKKAGFKNVMTFHIARHSCKTGNVMYKDKVYCDGTINIEKCTKCNFAVNGLREAKAQMIFPVAKMFYLLGYDSTSWNSTLGTAVGYPFVIKKLRQNLWDIIENCERSVVLTRWYKNALLQNKIPVDKLVYIPQAVPRSYAKINQQRKSSLPLKLVFIGRIIHAKGVHLLVEAISGLPANEVTLSIYGQENDELYVQKLKEISSAHSNIQWKGMLAPEDVHGVLMTYDVLCISSLVCEMSPLVIQEAFAAGVPVLGSDIPGNAEQIEQGVNGWLFNFNDVLSLREQIKKLIDNPSLVDDARKNIPEVNSFSAVAEEYEKLYLEIIL